MSTSTVLIKPQARATWVQAVLLLLRLGMAGVFVAAAIPKIVDPEGFALSVLNYQMLPAWGVNTLSITLPWLELVIGLFLGLGLWSRASALIMALLMVVFMVAFALAKSRGLNISCGCFDVGASNGPSSIVLVVLRDTGFLVASLVLVRFQEAPSVVGFLRQRGFLGSVSSRRTG